MTRTLNNPCDGLAPDEAILYMKEESTNPQKLRILFLTELKKNQEEMQVLIFDIEDDRKLPNIVMGKFDGGSFTIKAGSYNIEKDTYGKMYVIVDLL